MPTRKREAWRFLPKDARVSFLANSPTRKNEGFRVT